MKKLILAIAMVYAPAHADTLTVTQGSDIRLFEGTVLAIDQRPEASQLRFRASSSISTPVPPAFGRYQPPPTYSWNVSVDDTDAEFVWSGQCTLTAQTYLEESNMHFYMTCEVKP